ncbi:unnamed protein product [Withania somnifera]
MMPPNSQFLQQFLSSVLSQRGPSSLPYTEDVKWLIRQHLLSLLDNFPSLQPKTASFTHNDGRTVNLLQAIGTVPMVFQNVTYNIPVIIWLMETYPRHPPLVFVNPTKDMVVKQAHPFVNPSGVVSIPYLQNWIYPSSNLVELARNLSVLFGRDPPLYAKTRPPSNPNPHPPPNTSFSSSVGLSADRPAIPPGGSQSHQQQHQRPPYVGGGTENAAVVFRRNVMDQLVVSLHKDVMELREAREMDVEGLFNVQGVLKQREEVLKQGLKEMQDEKEGLEQQLQMVLMNSDVLEGWLRENEGKLKNLGNVDVDMVFEPCDNLSKQMLDCTAADLALEDVIYSLDKAIQGGTIPFDQYLRNIRLLSREQFFHRATASKVRAAQMQAQVANMAARTSPYAL